MPNKLEFLHPDHLADLRKSGLSDETIFESGIKSVRPADIDMKIGFPTQATSAYEIPYGENGYSRFKMFYSEENRINPKTGEERPKYLCKKGSENHLYIPSKTRPILDDSSILIYVIEGEKKALRTTQGDLPCIAISGLWNWSNGSGGLISDFDLIALDGRTILVVPDNDFLLPDRHGKPKNLKKAVYELAYKLIDRGAKVSLVELPQDELKIGLDDYLCSQSVNDFKKLPVHTIRKLTIQEAIDEVNEDIPFDEVKEILKRIALLTHKSEQSKYINALSERTGISKRGLQGDIKSFVKKSMPEGESQTTISAYFPELVDVVINESGDVVYLIYNENSLEVASVSNINGILFTPPAKEHLPFLLPRADEVIRWYTSDNDQKLFGDVLAYLKRFSCLPDRQWLIVACNVFLGYIQDNPEVHYLPMLLFFAVPERGKSRTGKAVTYISYRGIYLVDLREANLFRFSQNLKATLFFDLMDLWRKAEKNGAEPKFDK